MFLAKSEISKRIVAAGCVALIAACLASASAMASATDKYEPLPHDSLYKMLEEVDVVAVKQRSDLQRTAVSGTVIGDKEVERENITDLKGASHIVPNFFIPDYGSRITSSIYVRGIGARMDQPAVGLNVDNVGILNKDAYDFELTDIVSIEMIRGPQSSLYGRNTMTGMVSIRTLSPVIFQGWKLGASFASGNALRLNAGWYHMFDHRLGMSISAGFTNSTGRFVNEYDGQKIDKERSGALRFRLHWNPSTAVTVTNVLSSSLLRQGGYPYESAETGKISYNDTCFYHRFLLTDGLTVRAKLAGMELLSVTSLQHINDNMTLDQDFLPDPYFTLTQKKRETAVTEDIMLRGSAADRKYTWLVGAYAFYRHLDMDAPVTFKKTGISRLIEVHRNNANPYYPIAWDEDAFALNSHFRLPSGGVALYHESALRLGNWHLTAGLRLDFERVNLRYNSWCNTSYTIYNNPSGVLPIPSDATPNRRVNVDLEEAGKLHRQYLMFLPKVSALYNLPDKVSNVYASIGRGYKAGGFNTQMFSDVLQQKLMGFMGMSSMYDVDDIVGYKPEQSWTYEVGGHFHFPSQSLSADVSLFYIDCRDQQMTVFPEGETTGRLMTNAGKTRSFGGEVSLRWSPVSNLMLTASYGYTNARFVQFNDGKQDYKGNWLPYAPSNTIYVNAVYNLSAAWLKSNMIQFSAGCNAAGKIYWNEANSLSQPFYARLNALVAFVAPTWRVEVFGENLTDTRFHTFYFMSMGNEFFQRGMPITLGASVSVNI